MRGDLLLLDIQIDNQGALKSLANFCIKEVDFPRKQVLPCFPYKRPSKSIVRTCKEYTAFLYVRA